MTELSTSLPEVATVLRAFDAAGIRYWLEGGWGVDALVGRQTRPHRDLDVDVDADAEATALRVLERLGYAVETDWRPNRVELVAPGRGWVDLHPLRLAPDGSARQAALDGGFHEFPAAWSTVGRLGELSVPCLTLEAQIAFHQGYDLRPSDHHDLALLERLASPAGPAGGATADQQVARRDAGAVASDDPADR